MSGTSYNTTSSSSSNLTTLNKKFYNAKNIRLKNGFARNPDRYYFEEYFEKLPAFERDDVSAITQDSDIVSSDEDTTIGTATVPKFSLSEGDVIHINAMAEVLSVNGGDRLRIKLRTNSIIAGITKLEQTFFNSGLHNVSTNDLVIIDLYIVVKKIVYSRRLEFKEYSMVLNYHGIVSIGNSNPTILNIDFDDNDNNSHSDTDNSFLFLAKWESSSVDNQIKCRSFITEINGSRVKNDNFSMFVRDINSIYGNSRRYNSDNDTVPTNFDENNSGINLTPLRKDDHLFLIPNTRSGLNKNIWSVNDGLEFECAFSFKGLQNPGVFRIGLIDKQNLENVLISGDLQNEISIKISINNITNVKYIQIFVYNSGKEYTSEVQGIIEDEVVYKFRISIDRKRRAHVFINDIQYNIVDNGGDLTEEGVRPTTQFGDAIQLVPYIKLRNETVNLPVTNFFLYYIKYSKFIGREPEQPTNDVPAE